MPVDYIFYTMAYEGNLIPEEAFARVMRRAEEILDADTFGEAARTLEAEDAPHAQAVRLTLCALAELCWRTHEGGPNGTPIVKESVGGWSREYAPTPAPRVAVLTIEARYLGDTGLLYRGRRRYV